MKALAQLVRAQPDAREPWLVFADWLSSIGDERGLAILLADRLNHSEITPSERVEIAQHYRNLEATFDDGLRGFAAFSTRFRHPSGSLLRTARFRLVGSHLSLLLRDAESLAQLDELDLGQNALGDEGAAVLSANALLPSLSRLRLHQNGIRARGLAALAPKMAVPRFLGLSLANNPIQDSRALARWEGMAALVALPSLRRLHAHYSGISPAELSALLHSGSSIVELALTGKPLGIEGLRALVSSEGARALAALTARPWSLTSLRIDCTGAGPEGAVAIAQSERGRGTALAESRAFCSLMELFLGENDLGKNAPGRLLRSEGLRGCTIRM